MRQFATDRWSEADHAALRSALTQHFAKAAEASREGMLGRMISRGSTGLTDEHDNLRLAFNWARAPSTRPPWRVMSWLAAIQMRSMAEEIPRGLDFITAMVSTNGGDAPVSFQGGRECRVRSIGPRSCRTCAQS